jgi:hypothetical protein
VKKGYISNAFELFRKALYVNPSDLSNSILLLHYPPSQNKCPVSEAEPTSAAMMWEQESALLIHM